MASDKDEAERSAKMFSKEEMLEAIKDVSRSLAEEMIPVVMAGNATVMQNLPKPVGVRQPFIPGPTCPCCGQLARACGGVPKIEGTATQAKKDAAFSVNHVKMVVYPQRYPEFGEWFRGRGLNGVWYLSNNQNHKIWVPKLAAGDFKHAVEHFETNERETRMGRTKQHNSGNLNSPDAVGKYGVEGWR